MSDTAVVFNVLARDRASKVFGNIARAAREGSSGIVAALGPGLLPVLASATAGIAGLGAALGGAGAALGVFGAVSKSAFTEIQEASGKTQDLVDKLDLLDEQIRVAKAMGDDALAGQLEKSRAKATNELIARYNLMPPALRNVTFAYDGMKRSWKGFVEQNKPQVYAIMTSGFSSPTAIIPKLQPLFDVGAAAAQRFVGWLSRVTANGGIDRFVAFLTSQAGPALDHLATIGRNLGVTLGAVLRATAPAGQGFLAWLAEASEKAAAFGQGGGFDRFMANVNSNGPAVASALSSIADTMSTLYQAISPLAPVSLAIAGALARIIAAVPPGVITAVVAAWITYSTAAKVHSTYVTASGIAMDLWGKRAKLAAVHAKAAAAGQWLLNGAMAAGRWAAATAQLGAYLIKQGAIALATKTWAAMQWLLNAAMSMNPIGLVVIAIVALIAIIVLLWTKCAWFRNFWIAVWNVIKSAAAAAWEWIKAKAAAFWTWVTGVANSIRTGFTNAWNGIKSAAGTAWDWIKSKVTTFYNWVTGLPGRISSKLSDMWSGLWSGFKSVANKIIAGWNNLSFTIGGGSVMGINIPRVQLDTPNLPYLAKGGNIMKAGGAIVGERGPELVSLRRGAQVTPLTGSRGGGIARIEIDIRGGDADMRRMIQKWIRTDNLLQVRTI